MTLNESKLDVALEAACAGNAKATDELLALLYDELRSLARSMMRSRKPGETLQATALVHEAYAKLIRKPQTAWNGSSHFFSAAARVMRDILIDVTRRKAALKRGGDHRRDYHELENIEFNVPGHDIEALNDALQKLEEFDGRKAEIVMLRFFSGLTISEIASALKVSKSTVEREWQFSRAWLFRELEA